MPARCDHLAVSAVINFQSSRRTRFGRLEIHFPIQRRFIIISMWRLEDRVDASRKPKQNKTKQARSKNNKSETHARKHVSSTHKREEHLVATTVCCLPLYVTLCGEVKHLVKQREAADVNHRMEQKKPHGAFLSVETYLRVQKGARSVRSPLREGQEETRGRTSKGTP